MVQSVRSLLPRTVLIALLGACSESLELPVAATAGGSASLTAPQARVTTMTIESSEHSIPGLAPVLPLQVTRVESEDGSSSLSVARHPSLPSAAAPHNLIRVTRLANGSLELVRANGVTESPRVPSTAFVGRRVGNQVAGQYSPELEAALRTPARKAGGGSGGTRQLPPRTAASPQRLLDSLVRSADERIDAGSGRVRLLSSFNGYRITTDFDMALGAVTSISTISPAGVEVTVTSSYWSSSRGAVLVARDTRVRSGGRSTVYKERFAPATATGNTQ